MFKSPPLEFPITLDLPSSLLREIGRVVTHFAFIEHLLSRIIYKLLQLDPVSGRLAVREPRVTDRLDLLRDLLKHRKISIKADLTKIRSDLAQCSADRDALAHGIWGKNPDEPGHLYLRLTGGNWRARNVTGKIKSKAYPQGEKYDSTKARIVLALIKKTGQAINGLEKEIDAALAASSEKSL